MDAKGATDMTSTKRHASVAIAANREAKPSRCEKCGKTVVRKRDRSGTYFQHASRIDFIACSNRRGGYLLRRSSGGPEDRARNS